MKAKPFILLMLSLVLLLGLDHAKEVEEYIITFNDHIDEAVLENAHIEIIESFDLFPGVVVQTSRDQLDQLILHSSIHTVEPNIQLTSTSSSSKNWGIEHLNIPQSWDSGYSGKGVKIAVIDSGIATNHSALKVTGGVSMVNYTNSYNDDFGHGTHAAGIIASTASKAPGVAQGVQLYAVKTLDRNGMGRLNDTIRGIEWAVNNGMDIINLSLGTDESHTALRSAVDEAHERGVIIVAAAGNKHSNFDKPMPVQYPARYGSVIAVSALDKNNKIARFSATGAAIELTAPGVDIYSTYLNNGYTHMDGTSMSSPFVAGVIALYKEAYPNASNIEIRRLVRNNALDLGAQGRDELFGFGLVQPPIKKGSTDPTLHSFKDVSINSWAAEHISYLFERNIITGYDNNQYFKPLDNVRRGQAVAMIGRSSNWDGTQRSTKFPDVRQDYFASGYVLEAINRGVISGYSDGTFGPNNFMTRGQMVKIIGKAYNLEGDYENTFSDVSETTTGAEALPILVELGIVGGYPDGTFQPNKPISRMQFAVIMARLLNEELRL
ncbi:S8 family peptidase [Halalkalibacter alkaliphilus]|uniref:S8 family serine peptidase n=1 Tax=Halalkalibacter alkaliphilus TaxID=2917993 RepID=A0A9X1ZWE3_9BACI|nr:S8 family serine peptidase [Halalkalibacter alkaliphilus]MCL7746779.1 S8 family serine peptidase [Halalkalibacter alkaliphilus]